MVVKLNIVKVMITGVQSDLELNLMDLYSQDSFKIRLLKSSSVKTEQNLRIKRTIQPYKLHIIKLVQECTNTTLI